MKTSSPLELQGFLLQLFQGHAVDAKADGDWITFPGRPGRILALVFDLDEVDPKCSTQVDIRFSPWPGCEICESFSGLAESREERIKQALSKFALNTFHVFLKVFLKIDCCEQTQEWQLTNQQVARTVTDGNAAFAGEIPANLPTVWIEQFHQLLATQPLSEGTHWIRLYYAQMEGKRLTLELLLDNDPWLSAIPVADSIPWPTGPGFFSLRQFLVLQGGLDVTRAIGLMAQHPQADDEQWTSLLISAGCSPIDAKRIVILAPIAFGRQLLQGLGVTTTTQCQLHNGPIIDLRSSPIFRTACTLAADFPKKRSMTQGEFFAIASRDACVNAVNQALSAGSEPRNLKFKSLTVFWDAAEPLCPLGSPVPDQTSVSKPWWKIW